MITFTEQLDAATGRTGGPETHFGWKPPRCAHCPFVSGDPDAFEEHFRVEHPEYWRKVWGWTPSGRAEIVTDLGV